MPLAARQVHQVQLGLADVLPAQGVVVDNLQMIMISLDYHLSMFRETFQAFWKYIPYLHDSAPGGRR